MDHHGDVVSQDFAQLLVEFERQGSSIVLTLWAWRGGVSGHVPNTSQQRLFGQGQPHLEHDLACVLGASLSPVGAATDCVG